MTAKERNLWEQAARVLRQNSVTTTTVAVDAPRAEQVLARAWELAEKGPWTTGYAPGSGIKEGS
jgi:hypothetical protein